MERTQTEIVVVGAGPGGYTAAFAAADAGREVLLVDQDSRPGGVCLNSGCIPSKALLHATQVVAEAEYSKNRGIRFDPPRVEIDGLRAWKDSILDKLSQGIRDLAEKRGVKSLHGRGHFEDSRTLRVETSEGQKFVRYDKAIIAVGSKPALPAAFDLGNPRVMTSTEALALEDVPGKLLVIGGGYIGMELGQVYAVLGSQVVLVEALGSILAGADSDLVRPVKRHAEKSFQSIRLSTKVSKLATSGKRIQVVMEAEGKKTEELYDRVLVAVGRVPNCEDLGLENTKIERGPDGFINVDSRRRTSDPSIYAVGDVVGGPLLAHKATREAKVAVESIAGIESAFDGIVVPCVVFTDPEVAWCGLTELEAKERGVAVEVSRFPWSASGRALTVDRPDGATKLILEPGTDRVLGVGMVGHGAGELISEGVLAVEMGATAGDIAESIHPHPTLSETLMECAEAFYGRSAHTVPQRHSQKG